MNRNEERYAIAVCFLILLLMGLAGWYENYNPVIPQPSVAQMTRACDREIEFNLVQEQGKR